MSHFCYNIPRFGRGGYKDRTVPDLAVPHMKIKIIEKRNVLIGIFSIIYFYSVLFIFSSQIIIFIEKRLFGYEKPNDFDYLDFIPPLEIVIPSFLIFLFAIILIYIFVLKLACRTEKIKV